MCVRVLSCLDVWLLTAGDDGANKSASHELRSLKCLIDCKIPGLNFPLMVCFCGILTLCRASLPVSPACVVRTGNGGLPGQASNGPILASASP